MSTFRVNKNKNYTVMSNTHLRDMGLSLKAKGLLSVMLSLPETWDYSIAGLVAICKENETAVKSALKELKESGYLIITRIMPNETKSGRIEYIYDIYEEPQKQEVEKQEVENLVVEIQAVEKQGQLNTNKESTDKLNTDISNTDYISVEGKFREFVDSYPKPVNEYEAYRVWVSLSMNADLFAKLMMGLADWKRSEQWTKNNGQYITNAVTFLRERRWETRPPQEQKPVQQKKVSTIDHHVANYDSQAYRNRANSAENYVYKKRNS